MKSFWFSRLQLAICLVLAGLPGVSAGAAPEAAGTLLAGTPFATNYYVRQGGQPGPVVLVTGGIHGDEPAGAAAAEEVRHWTVARGRLVVIPRVNVTGLAAGRRTMSGVDAALEDLNRDFPRVGKNESPRGTPALEIWRLVRDQKPAWLIDLHESHTLHGSRPGSVGNSLLCCPSSDMTRAMPAMLDALNAPITDPRQKFITPRPPRDGSLARAAGEHLGIRALIVETTQVDQPSAVRIEQHCRLVRGLLTYLGMGPSR